MSTKNKDELYAGFVLTFEPERTAWLADKLFPETKFELKESFSALDSAFERRELVLLVLSQEPISIAAIAIMERMHGSGGSGKLKMRMPKLVVFDNPVSNDEFSGIQPSNFLCTPETIRRTSSDAWTSLLVQLKAVRPQYEKTINDLISARDTEHRLFGDDTRTIRLNEERDGLGLSLSIAQMRRASVLRGIDATRAEKANSILDLLDKSISIHERSIVEHDRNILELALGDASYRYATFFGENDRSVKVYVTDKTPIETAVGTDLLIYNSCFENFILIQYKMMEKSSDSWWYKADDQLRFQLQTMDAFHTQAVQTPKPSPTMWSYRLNEDPFYFKFCERVRPKARDDSLIQGITMCRQQLVEFMGLPQAKRGTSTAIGYDNCPRYFNNTEFIQLASTGWIGAGQQASALIKQILEANRSGGKRAMLAIIKAPKLHSASERPHAGSDEVSPSSSL